MCLIGNEALSADHKNQKKASLMIGKSAIYVKMVSLMNYKGRNHFI